MKRLVFLLVLLASSAQAQFPICVRDAMCIGGVAAWRHPIRLTSQTPLSPAYQLEHAGTVPMLWNLYAQDQNVYIDTNAAAPDGSDPQSELVLRNSGMIGTVGLSVEAGTRSGMYGFQDSQDAAITGNTNNWTGACVQNGFFRIVPTGNFELTGIEVNDPGPCPYGTIHGRQIVLLNVDTTNTLTLRDESGSSDADNRLALRGDVALAPGYGIQLIYDATSSRWRPMGSDLFSAPGGADGLGPDGDKGDVTVGGTGTTLTVDPDAITYAKIQNVAGDDRFLGRISGASGDIEELTGTQATTLLDTYTDLLKGLVPASGGGTTNFLRADGSWVAPPGGSGGLSYAEVAAASMAGF